MILITQNLFLKITKTTNDLFWRNYRKSKNWGEMLITEPLVISYRFAIAEFYQNPVIYKPIMVFIKAKIHIKLSKFKRFSLVKSIPSYWTVISMAIRN